MKLRDYFEGWLSADDLRDANNRLAIYGGSFDTALLELELLSPTELVAALRVARGLEPAPPELLTPGLERPWAEMPDAWLLARDVVPLAVRDGRLWVAIHPDLAEERLTALRAALPDAVLTVTAAACVQHIADERRGHIGPRDLVLATTFAEALQAASGRATARPSAARPSASRPVDPADSDVTITIVDDGLDDASASDSRRLATLIPSLQRGEPSVSADETEIVVEDDQSFTAVEDAVPAVIPRLKRIDSSLYIAAEPREEEVEIETEPEVAAAPEPAPEPAPAPAPVSAPEPVSAPAPAAELAPVIPSLMRSDTSVAAATTAASASASVAPVGGEPAHPVPEAAPESPVLEDSSKIEHAPAGEPSPTIIPVIPSLKRPTAAATSTAAPAPAPTPPPNEPAPAVVLDAPAAEAPSPVAGARSTQASAEADAPVPRGHARSGGYVPSTLLQARPPSDRHDAAASIETELEAALSAGGRREAMIDRLRQAGEAAYSKIAEIFPGPLDLPRGDLKNLPQASAHGPLLRLCIILGEAIAPSILPRLRDPNANTRFYAALVFQELRSPSCVGPLADLAFDDDRDVRTIAMRVLETYHGAAGHARAVQRIRGDLNNPDLQRRKQAIQAMGTLRDVFAVPRLIDALDEDDLEIRAASLTSLCAITGQHLGMASGPWRAWHVARGRLSRGEWMLDSLAHSDAAVRRWAAEELVRTTGQRIAFDPRGSEEERAESITRWRAWISEHASATPPS